MRFQEFSLGTAWLAILLVVLTLVGRDVASRTSLGGEPKDATALIRSLPDPHRTGRWSVDLYIKAAAELQAIPPEAAAKLLLSLADEEDRRRTFLPNSVVLCRMLFTPKVKGDFRRPALGGTTFMGSTDYPDWPLEPIELVDGIPFLIVRGYRLLKQSEPATWYVEYCLQKCDWTTIRYNPKTADEKKDALAKLLASTKWKAVLDARDREFLAAQIR